MKINIKRRSFIIATLSLALIAALVASFIVFNFSWLAIFTICSFVGAVSMLVGVKQGYFNTDREPLRKLVDNYRSVSKKAKKGFVNLFPTNLLLNLSKVLPIGDWLEYKEDRYGDNPLLVAMTEKDLKTVDNILKKISKPVLYKYLLDKSNSSLGILQCAIFDYFETTDVLKKILNAIEPNERLRILKSIEVFAHSYVRSLLILPWCEAHTEVVMIALPEKDRAEFMEQVDENLNTPLMLSASYNKNWQRMAAFLRYYPQENRICYLNFVNMDGFTFLMLLANLEDNDDAFENLLTLIPSERKKDYLQYYDQGNKAILIAHVKGNHRKKELLKTLGIIEPEEFKHRNIDELKAIIASWSEKDVWANKEKFKEEHGADPYDLLGLKEGERDSSTIRRAYYKLMLQEHPDKNSNSAISHSHSQNIIDAYTFANNRALRTRVKLTESKNDKQDNRENNSLIRTRYIQN